MNRYCVEKEVLMFCIVLESLDLGRNEREKKDKTAPSEKVADWRIVLFVKFLF